MMYTIGQSTAMIKVPQQRRLPLLWYFRHSCSLVYVIFVILTKSVISFSITLLYQTCHSFSLSLYIHIFLHVLIHAMYAPQRMKYPQTLKKRPANHLAITLVRPAPSTPPKQQPQQPLHSCDDIGSMLMIFGNVQQCFSDFSVTLR